MVPRSAVIINNFVSRVPAEAQQFLHKYLGTHHGVRATREYARFVMCVPGTRVLSGNYIRLTLLADVAVPMMQHAPTSCYHRPFVRSQNPGRSCMLLN